MSHHDIETRATIRSDDGGCMFCPLKMKDGRPVIDRTDIVYFRVTGCFEFRFCERHAIEFLLKSGQALAGALLELLDKREGAAR